MTLVTLRILLVCKRAEIDCLYRFAARSTSEVEHTVSRSAVGHLNFERAWSWAVVSSRQHRLDALSYSVNQTNVQLIDTHGTYEPH